MTSDITRQRPPDYHVIIPARMASSRLPGKMLAEIDGRALIIHTLERALASNAQSVHVATDDQRIASVVAEAGGRFIMTSGEHASGTDRLVEAVAALALPDRAVVVNLQGDEPRMPLRCLDQVARLLQTQPAAQMSTLWSAIDSKADWQNPNVVKLTAGHEGRALYFSRAGIPHSRSGDWPEQQACRHVGLYAYRVASLQAWPGLPFSALEQLEVLEQLRALQAGWWIATAEAEQSIPLGIDTPDDLRSFREKVA